MAWDLCFQEYCYARLLINEKCQKYLIDVVCTWTLNHHITLQHYKQEKLHNDKNNNNNTENNKSISALKK